jgi:YbgC/YbaW family acyl-CoA thioester hydrolase
VEWQDLDALEHVNNAIYVTYAEEAAAQDFAARGWTPVKLAEQKLTVATRRFQVQYQSPAVWGETLTISTHPLTASETGGSRYVGMTRADGSSVCECLLDWELVDRETGAVQKLPDGLCSSR